MTAQDLYNTHSKTRIEKVNNKVYMSVLDYFREGFKNGSLYSIAKQKADAWTMHEEENQKKAYLDDLKIDRGWFGSLFRGPAPKQYSKDFKDGFAFGYMEGCRKERFLADKVPQEKLEALWKYLNDNGISITAVNNELLVQNSKEIGEVIEYKLVEE